MDAADAEALEDWPDFLTIRPQQDGLLQSPALYVLLLAGRRGGKGFSLAHAAHMAVHRGGYKRLLIAGATAGDARDSIVDTVLAGGPASQRPVYEPSLRLMTWPNGATGQVRYGSEPDSFRGVVRDRIGPDLVLIDELGSWKVVRGEHAFDVLEFTLLDAGEAPSKMLIATTPQQKHPASQRIIRNLMKMPECEVRSWETRANAANLDRRRMDSLYDRYGGTRLGRQELSGEVLDDYEGALWTWEMIETAEKAWRATEPERVAVAVDPAESANAASDYTAIAVAGKVGDGGQVNHVERGKWRPEEWARRAIALYHEYDADVLLAERNAGGDMVEHTIRMAGGPHVRTIHASKGKAARAEPVALMYEQGRIAHAPDLPEDLAYEMTGFPVSGGNDDMVDAVVYALTEVAVEQPSTPFMLLW